MGSLNTPAGLLNSPFMGCVLHWIPVRDGHPYAVGLADRHYSGKRRGRPRMIRQVLGPGEKLLLVTADGRAVFGWLKKQYRMDGQDGIECPIFRNEGERLSSALILEAEYPALRRWPAEDRLFTYVDPKEVASPNPGYCFLKAGWRRTGETTPNGLILLEKIVCPTK